MGYGAFYVICPRASSQYVTTLSAGEGSDRLQLIKFWPFRVPGKGVCGGAKFFGSALITKASAQRLRLSEHFFSLFCYCLRKTNSDLSQRR